MALAPVTPPHQYPNGGKQEENAYSRRFEGARIEWRRVCRALKVARNDTTAPMLIVGQAPGCVNREITLCQLAGWRRYSRR